MMLSSSLAASIGQEEQGLPSVMRKPRQSKSLRILLAEDNFLDQQIARKMFKMLGHQVDIVKNGIEAVDAAKSKAYDLIVMDIQMPIMDGIEAAKSIRKFRGNALKIIFVSSSEPSIYRDLCIEAGGDEFLTKPLTVSKLNAAIK
jgi:CheY-like chemotaxis protein